jgi:hypothetical protein
MVLPLLSCDLHKKMVARAHFQKIAAQKVTKKELHIVNIYGCIVYKHVDCLISNKPSVVDFNRNGLSVSISVYVIFVFIFLV